MKDKETLDMIERQLGKENKKKEDWFKNLKNYNLKGHLPKDKKINKK
jgi:hypothetical protein